MTDQILRLITDNERFVITTHIKPDGDAIGSQVALGSFLRKLGKQVALLNSDPLPYNLYWVPGVEEVQVFDGSLTQREQIAAADVLFVVDTNAQDRLGKLATSVRNASGTKVLIDHHTNPERWFDVVFARESASSTGELIYELIAAHDAGLIDTLVASNLYTAIMTDTGSFRYSSVTPRVHRIIADLLERGDIEPAPIHVALYDTRTIQGLRLLGLALDSISLMYDGQVGYMVVSQRMVREANSSLEETEGFVNYVLSIEGVDAAVLFSEIESGTKVSFRSKGTAYVNEWARHFGGGGHRNAAGAFVKRSLQEVVDDVMAAAPRFLNLQENESGEDESLSPEDLSYLSSLMDLKSQKAAS